ncbi:hypothetical protein IFM89_003459 [Coptis chinensis]|uniref:Uncharacterized protein n=1 Tax=Coptis chinensis TaxID=261450 RepID=A0A835LKD8_9MAGN|nr:hypothetical protein IFM89_003459 [Coptis chinensis]
MADQEFANVSSLVQIPQCSSPQKLAPGVPLASYIEAVKQGEEPIIFGPSSRLVSYGDGWKLQTATNGGRGKQSNLEVAHQEFPNVIEQATDNVEFAGEVQFQPEVPQQEVETPIVSEAVSNIESISEKIDMTDVFTTDTVFNSRDELLKWTRELGKSVGTVIVIKKSDLGSVAEAGFALRLINRKLDSGIPLASYIEAVKEGEEPISFGPNAVLVDYGYGWKLQTVIDEGFVKEKWERTTNEQTPDVVQKTDNLQRSTSELKPHISFPYIGRIVLALTFIILLGVMFTLALENLPRLFLFVTSSM